MNFKNMHLKIKGNLYANLIVASLLFFYSFGLFDVLNVLNLKLSTHYSLSPNEIGTISSYYFYGNVLFLIPAGIIVDRFNLKPIFLTAIFLSSFFTLLLSYTDNIFIFCLLRFLGGCCAAFGFIACVKLISLTFPSQAMARGTTILATMGMLGAYVTQSPLALLEQHYSLKTIFLILGSIGLLIFVIQFYLLSTPSNTQKKKLQLNILAVAKKRLNILCALYTSLMNLPIFILASLWGVPFLKNVDRYNIVAAAEVTGMLLIGTIFGMPIIGYIADKFENKKYVMFISSFLSLIIATVIIKSHPSFSIEIILFFLLGFSTSAQVLSYPLVVDNNPLKNTAIATSIISICSLLFGAISQPFFGSLLEFFQKTGISTSDSYQHALYCLPVIFICTIFISLLIKEREQ